MPSGSQNGISNNPNGKPKGCNSKKTELAREAIANFVDRNVPRFETWLDEIYEQNGPKVAFDCVKDLLEYHVPKLSRTETKLEGHLDFANKLSEMDDV